MHRSHVLRNTGTRLNYQVAGETHHLGSHNTHYMVEPSMAHCSTLERDCIVMPQARDAMELQQVRRREALLRESKKERELQREQGLIAKPASLMSLITKDN
ncbi:unnamed protein product [Timema podura]|uniref:Uncharacterized protein n=1 Tax=Timema podura TaxID=61482 RepID=A0ABN7P1X6_TIMPD|nr:unnamed protein product [Timema podura]